MSARTMSEHSLTCYLEIASAGNFELLIKDNDAIVQANVH